MSIIKSKAKTDKELRKELRGLKPYGKELLVGNNAILKTSSGYGVRHKNDHSDPYTDYNAHIFGYKEKWIVDRAITDKVIKRSESKLPKIKAKK